MEVKKSELFSDLHIHSRFSRACSKDINIPNLVKWARVKGLNVLGTGDFQHPEWFKDLNDLTEKEGIVYYKDETGDFPFIWTSEISLMYTRGKGRRVHYVLLAPNKDVVKQITSFLGSKGRLDYDGRPIFGFTSVELVDFMSEIDSKIEIIPAHAWTPWFGIFGSNSGYDSLKEAFEDRVDKIHAIETGMSSDPGMNWRIKELEKRSIISFSDSHSFWPWRLGREATIFSLKEDQLLTYDEILRQIRENDFIGTVETDPCYGKYHYDGHRDCKFSCGPNESEELKGICPKCGKPLVIGVENRVDKLADFQSGHKPFGAKDYYKMLPLHEIISLRIGTSMNSKKCWEIYNGLIKRFNNEFNVLLNVKRIDLMSFSKDELLTDLIIKNRSGNIKVNPGYDGEYGVAVLEKDNTQDKKQRTLF